MNAELPQLIGNSDKMREIRDDIQCAARTDAKVLINGETGSGKEVATRLIHLRSGRSRAPLVTINCAGVPDSLLESELFGHTRGSFTGAHDDKAGLLETAHNGTLFLDEVGEMTMRMQTLLLRFLESGEIQRVGAHRVHQRLNVRLITATNRDLSAHMQSGAFREDLYYRLNVIRIVLPPLRERREDIPDVVDYFLDLYSRRANLPKPTLTPAALDVLMAHSWPGNVRELRNTVERIMLRSAGRTIGPSNLPSDLLPATPAVPALAAASHARTLDDTVEQLAARLFDRRESFWAGIYQEFMSRDLTREHIRRLVAMGLQCTNGNYRLVVELFNLPPSDYKRFLTFLRKHNCRLPYQPFRVSPGRAPLRAAHATPRRAHVVGES